jgi:anhydro-N-acetylmuramic acid kinase
MNPRFFSRFASASRPHNVIGMMSGTSVDGVSVALAQITGFGKESRVKLKRYWEHPYPATLKKRVLALHAGIKPKHDSYLREIAELNYLIGELFGDAVNATIRAARVSRAEVDLIGSHGQTVYHHSSQPGALRCTLQIGDGDVIAARSGITVVSDFRQRDLAFGGEGAPLTPYPDLLIYGVRKEKNRQRAILNLGGVANITLLNQNPEKIFGFDIGPANSLIDRLSRRLSNGKREFDRDGEIAKSGNVNHKLLSLLLKEDSFLKIKPPKSTGFELYGEKFLERAIKLNNGADSNLMATLVAFSVEMIKLSIVKYVTSCFEGLEVIVAGGGAKNGFFIERLNAALLPAALIISDEIGIPSQARESLAFAVLAHEAAVARISSFPRITGVSRGVTLGKISWAE